MIWDELWDVWDLNEMIIMLIKKESLENLSRIRGRLGFPKKSC